MRLLSKLVQHSFQVWVEAAVGRSTTLSSVQRLTADGETRLSHTADAGPHIGPLSTLTHCTLVNTLSHCTLVNILSHSHMADAGPHI